MCLLSTCKGNLSRSDSKTASLFWCTCPCHYCRLTKTWGTKQPHQYSILESSQKEPRSQQRPSDPAKCQSKSSGSHLKAFRRTEGSKTQLVSRLAVLRRHIAQRLVRKALDFAGSSSLRPPAHGSVLGSA